MNIFILISLIVMVGIICVYKSIIYKKDQKCGDYGCSYCHPTEYEEEFGKQEDKCRYKKR